MATMSPDPTLFIGVDPSGGRKPFTYAALDQSGRLIALKDGEVEDVQAFIASQPGAIVAVNAPQRPSIGLVQQDKIDQNSSVRRTPSRGLAMRLAEHQLRECGINIATTPARKELCAHWVQAGFDFYRRLESLGFLPYPTPGTSRQWLETHPHAVFCVLLGQTPLARPTLEGRQQRQLALYEQRLGIRDPMEFFEEITRHKLLKGTLPVEQIYTAEELDALAAAYMAYVVGCHPERIGNVGDPQEGQIFLPARELKTKY
jgi:hypothetical protein